jgi:hypothetical protein
MKPSWVANENRLDTIIVLDLNTSMDSVETTTLSHEEILYNFLAFSFNFKLYKKKVAVVDRLKIILEKTNSYSLCGSNLKMILHKIEELTDGNPNN